MRDFTLQTLQLLFDTLLSSGYNFVTVAGYLRNPSTPAVILRHDVDARAGNALKCAELESGLGLTGTYYFRAVPGSWDVAVMAEIARMGHEVGYHYEDLASARGNYPQAISSFADNLAKLRRVVPVETICMHGSPLSKYDNRQLWTKYDYRDYEIVGEPYLDIDFRKVLYLTDTGRRWNGERYSIRDHVMTDENTEPRYQRHKAQTPLRTTGDLINAAQSGNLPRVLMLTLHPQRWDDRFIPWLYELIWQNTKNLVKQIVTKKQKGATKR